MNQRADIINRIAKAASFEEQAALVAALDTYDRDTRQATASANSIDLAAATVEQTLRPVAVHERSTIATDWLGSVEASLGGENAQSEITVEAAMWYRRLSPEVRADGDEFAEQARGMARRTASKYGEQADGLASEFLTYVSFLRSREAASGLPQIQQIMDAHENVAPEQLNTKVFDNFAPIVDPINAGTVGTETSERNPLLAEIEGNGGTQVAPAEPVHHDTAPQVTSVAINHFATLDDFREGGQFHEAASGLPQVQQIVDAQNEQPAPNPLNPEVAFPWDLNGQGLAQPGIPSVGEEGGPAPKQASFRRRAAYVAGLMAREPHSLSEAERNEVIAFTALLKTADQWTEGAPQPTTTPVANQDQTVPTSYSPADGYAPAPETAEGRMPPGAGGDRVASLQTVAEGYGTSESGPYAKDQYCGNCNGTQTNAQGGSCGACNGTGWKPGAQGHGEALAAQGAKTAAKTHHCKHDGHVYTDDGDSCTKCGVGKSAAKQASDNHTTCPNHEDQSYNKSTGDCSCGSNHHRWANSNNPGGQKKSSLRVSASFTSPVEQADPEFAKGYKYATKWTPKTRLVTTGSAAFEAGMYAGISDNPAQQSAWVQAHRKAAQRFAKREFLKRLAVHREFTKQASRHLAGVRVVGSYLQVESGTYDGGSPVNEDCAKCGKGPKDCEHSGKERQEKAASKTAATTTDLDTMNQTSSPSPTGQTPINGPGTPGPLAGGNDPAAPGGPSPYQGAEPFGAPVVGNPGSAHGTPTAIDTTPGAAVDQASLERLSPQTLAFRRRVQASLLQTRQGK